jgi:UDP-glucuronate 4-epimerase
MSNIRTAKVLVTGSAGFIGSHITLALLEKGLSVYGIDNMNSYYDVNLKWDRLNRLTVFPNYQHHMVDLSDEHHTSAIIEHLKPDVVIHLAAQAGVRYATENPHSYINSNIIGFFHLLEAMRRNGIEHFLFASSSSVYGNNQCLPYSEDDQTDEPLNLYAATKKADESIAYSYAHRYGIPTTALRFFTVYGPWGRPDMTPYSFTKAILEKIPITLFNYGKYKRSFTYIDDIVEWIIRLVDMPPNHGTIDGFHGQSDPIPSKTPYQLFNLGHDESIDMLSFTRLLEEKLDKRAKIRLVPPQPGEVIETLADISKVTQKTGYRPQTRLREGLDHLVDWYMDYCQPMHQAGRY